MSKQSRFSKITDEEFIGIIKESEFMVDVLEKLGYNRTSGTMTKYIKERIKKLNIDITHFKGQKGNRGNNNGNIRYTLEDIMIKDSTYTNRTCLKLRIVKAGLLEYICERCGQLPLWNEKPLVLHLDHKNGIFNDHRLENLRFLCPNCHSQTETYSGKNMKKNSDKSDL